MILLLIFSSSPTLMCSSGLPVFLQWAYIAASDPHLDHSDFTF